MKASKFSDALKAFILKNRAQTAFWLDMEPVSCKSKKISGHFEFVDADKAASTNAIRIRLVYSYRL